MLPLLKYFSLDLITRITLKKLASVLRYAYNFDGIDDYGVFAKRLINIDANNTIWFNIPSDISINGSNKVIISQNINAGGSSQEFTLFVSGTTGNLGLTIGGTTLAVGNSGEFSAGERLRLDLMVNTRALYRSSGALIRTGSMTIGTAREPSAPTVVGARTNGVIGTSHSYASGLQSNIVVNGFAYPIADRNQTIQLPEPSGLGSELLTAQIIENPASKGSQWNYLGNGRWQYIGDGSYNQLVFIPAASQPISGFVEFEVESLTGTMACSITPQATPNLSVNSDSRFGSNTVGGKFRFYYTSKGNVDNASAGNVIEFKRAFAGQAASCVLKNFSFKPLGACNPLILRNTNPDRWQVVKS